MSDLVILRCTTTEDGRAESTLPVPRDAWEEMPEPAREQERNRVRAMHANYLQATRGVSVEPGSLPVTVDVAGLVRPGEKPAP
jgi:hypothetical protein